MYAGPVIRCDYPSHQSTYIIKTTVATPLKILDNGDQHTTLAMIVDLNPSLTPPSLIHPSSANVVNTTGTTTPILGRLILDDGEQVDLHIDEISTLCTVSMNLLLMQHNEIRRDKYY